MKEREQAMGMGMHLSMGLRQEMRLEMTMQLVPTEWSLVTAYGKYGGAPPPYVEPTFAEESFTPRLKLERQRIDGFDTLGHVARLRAIDRANAVFQFVYMTDRGRTNDETVYYKMPIRRGYEERMPRKRIRMSERAFERACAIIEAVGEVERIVRAIPYYRLYREVTQQLRKKYGVELADVVLVSIDRGGRIPCMILMHALGLSSMQSLKVDQGGRRLDTDRLDQFIAERTLAGKHVLFVDSTVDSGRQIRVLEQYFDRVPWKSRLGHRSWSVVGSNENGRNLKRHQNINWGVDPDRTFEDKPALMGIDYAPGTLTKVVECPSPASEALRRFILAVPDGWIYTAADIDGQIAWQRRRWAARQKERRVAHQATIVAGKAEHRKTMERYRTERDVFEREARFERRLQRIVASKRWRDLAAQTFTLPEEQFPAVIPNGTTHAMHNILVVGRGQCDLPAPAAQFIADNLGPHCSFLAGTRRGNPGAVLAATLASPRVANPEVRLYQQGLATSGVTETHRGLTSVYIEDRAAMRRQMIADSHVVLTLGGMEGTLREVLLALDMGKPTILIQDYGPVAAYILGTKSLARRSNCIAVPSLVAAAEKILSLSAAA